MMELNPIRKAKSDITEFCSAGISSCTVVRLVDQRPSHIYLWSAADKGLCFSAQSIDIAPRLEVGVVSVAKAEKRAIVGIESARQEIFLSNAFGAPIVAHALVSETSGVEFDTGIYFSTGAGGEIRIVAANYPHSLSFKIEERSKDYEPEVWAPDVRYLLLAG